MTDERLREVERTHAAQPTPDTARALAVETCRAQGHDVPDGLLYVRETTDHAPDGAHHIRTVYKACRRCGQCETVDEVHTHNRSYDHEEMERLRAMLRKAREDDAAAALAGLRVVTPWDAPVAVGRVVFCATCAAEMDAHEWDDHRRTHGLPPGPP